jgi:25S rRNA (cytosine2870-C5)-methyltransferase
MMLMNSTRHMIRLQNLKQIFTANIHLPNQPIPQEGLKIIDGTFSLGSTPEYLSGKYMVQSASSLVPVMALCPQPNEKILDMAAAPGGKTTHIGQRMQNTGTLFANDIRADRCKSLMANIHRKENKV